MTLIFIGYFAELSINLAPTCCENLLASSMLTFLYSFKSALFPTNIQYYMVGL